MRVAVFGAGCVGCVSAACLAELGHQVWLVEVSAAKRRRLEAGGCPVAEPGLAEMFARHLASGALVPTGSAARAVSATSLALICVGSPSRPDGRSDLGQLVRVIRSLCAAPLQGTGSYVVVLRSTVALPDLDEYVLPELERAWGEGFGSAVTFALNPEFLRQGSAVEDFLRPPFVVVGTHHRTAARRLRELYEGVEAPVWVVSPGTASLLKYACNSFHALKVAFANELGAISSLFGADPDTVLELLCQDENLNISPAYLRPGFAFGGPCLGKDLEALSTLSESRGLGAPLLRSVLESNQGLVDRTVAAVAACGARRLALVGLSFKNRTDDLRQSPFVELARELHERGRKLRIYDPDVVVERLVGQNLGYVEEELPGFQKLLCSSFDEAVEEAELVLVGKLVPRLGELLDRLPGGCRILDLTRRLPARPGLLHCGAFGLEEVEVPGEGSRSGVRRRAREARQDQLLFPGTSMPDRDHDSGVARANRR